MACEVGWMAIACRAGVMTRADRDKLVREVAVLGEIKPAKVK